MSNDDHFAARVNPDAAGAPEPSADARVDARGHRCPMPLLMAKRALNALADGQLLFLLATDPGAERDFEVFARQSGNDLLRSWSQGDEFHFLLRKR
ncbi:MAG: tRNA 2-thiouridine synthesizing protein A [Halieaceae bacterium]